MLDFEKLLKRFVANRYGTAPGRMQSRLGIFETFDTIYPLYSGITWLYFHVKYLRWR